MKLIDVDTYDPRSALVNDLSPQSHPELFTDAAIMLEVKNLMRLNRRFGQHPLRTATYLRLLAFIENRQAAAS